MEETPLADRSSNKLTTPALNALFMAVMWLVDDANALSTSSTNHARSLLSTLSTLPKTTRAGELESVNDGHFKGKT